MEPYLLREQFIVRTPRGRVATPRAYQVLGKPPKAAPTPPNANDRGLFDEIE
ncbi:MAG: Holliday junction DNA helicase RuvB C-terminal domain-containing protein [Gemmataceae bacterium]